MNYYLPKYAKDGPAMGTAILCVMYNRLGESEKAASIFSDSYKANEVPPFGVLSECAGGTNPYFATGAGGMLQAVLAGFGGLEIGKTGITQRKSVLPKGWLSMTIKGVGRDKKTFTVGK